MNGTSTCWVPSLSPLPKSTYVYEAESGLALSFCLKDLSACPRCGRSPSMSDESSSQRTSVYTMQPATPSHCPAISRSLLRATSRAGIRSCAVAIGLTVVPATVAGAGTSEPGKPLYGSKS